MEKTERKFEACPVCKLREELAEILGKPELKLGDGKGRFFESLEQELKDLGFARGEWIFRFQNPSGVVVDNAKEASIPIGAEVPGFEVETDICPDCGMVYAVKLVSGGAKKALPPPKIVMTSGEMPHFGKPPSDLGHN